MEAPRHIAVIGAGKMGLPLACLMASRGAQVIACDRNAELVERINGADCPFNEPGLPELLQEVRSAGRLTATTDTAAAVARADAIIVIVPVLLDAENRADLSIIEAVTETIAGSMRRRALVIYETTLPVGTTRRLGERISSVTGWDVDTDFGLAFSPERVKSRLVLQRLSETPKVVGGIGPKSLKRARALYREYLGAEVIDAGSPEAAEYTKLADMVYRDVNIALSNELARYAEAAGLDFDRVREAANTSGEAHLLIPGIGVGGHCTPVYPWFLIHDAHTRLTPPALTEAARATNEKQPAWQIERLANQWRSLRRRHVLILGLGFRPEVKEHTHSPAFALGVALKARGASVRLHDPHYTEEEIRALGFRPHEDWTDGWAEAFVLNTAHKAYRKPEWKALAKAGLKAVLDGRNAWKPRKIRDAGIRYIAVGKG